MGIEIHTPVSVGEIIDKITILEIKERHISQSEKLKNIVKEKTLLTKILHQHISLSDEIGALWNELREVNQKLWDVEDRLRDFERNKDFGECFITDARAVYFTNDRRSEIKRAINLLAGSDLIEEKSYQKY